MEQMEQRLAGADFIRDPHGAWSRIDDVYETVVTLDDEPGFWMVTIFNSDSEDPDNPARFRVSDEGRWVDGDGIDSDTAQVLYDELFEVTP